MDAPHPLSRRDFLTRVLPAVAATALVKPLGAAAPATGERRMKLCLTPGSIGVTATQLEAIELAAQYGFEAVEPFGNYLAGLSLEQLRDVVALLQKKQLAWGKPPEYCGSMGFGSAWNT